MQSKQLTFLLLASVALTSSVSLAADAPPFYLDAQRPIPERIKDLLPRMTLDEKISQITDDWGVPAIARLKVPALLKTEGLHGQSYSNGATIFPHAIAMASTWNPALINQVGAATGTEAKAVGIYQTWSPVLDVARDARWGRVEETYGEDPWLVSRMGVAWIEGFQSQGLIATPKHFAGHGGPEGGRDSNDVGLSERVLRETHLPPFRAAFEEAKAGGVMAAYGTWNGAPDNASSSLLQGILRQEWGFNGTVVTDCGAIEQLVTKHAVAPTFEEASKMALGCGVNIECGPIWRKYLPKAIQEGLISETMVDDAVKPVLETKFRLGLFEKPGPAHLNWDRVDAYDTPEHRALAREVAVQSMVLVKNENKLLPLSKTTKTIAVIGPNAAEVQTGDYSGKAVAGQLISVLDGIKSHVSKETQVLYAPGFNWQNPDDKSGFDAAVNIAKQADVVIMVMGDCSPNPSAATRPKSTTGENIDGSTLLMPGVQSDLIKAVQAVGKPVVLDVVNGKPFVLGWENDNIPAILVSWYSGEESGNATADLLFGDRNPSGKLPITFPRSASQLPLTYDYKTSGRSYDYYDMLFSPLYRFGYGLSYTTFQYSNLQTKADAQNSGDVTVTVDVKNTGTVAGDEVAQLYITDALASVTTPVMQLKGFQRLSLNAGETKQAAFHLTPYDLSLLNEGMVRVVEPGTFRVHVGGSSPEIPLRSATDRRAQGQDQKKNVGFKDASQGVSGEFNVTQPYAARFVYSLQAPPKVLAGQTVPVTLTVKNTGNLTDVTEADLYRGALLGSRRFELAPGETKSATLSVALYSAGAGTLSVVGSGSMASIPLTVDKSSARLSLAPLRTQVGDDGVITFTTTATDIGSEPFAGKLALTVDGAAVNAQTLQLQPGEQKPVTLQYNAPRSGNIKVQLGDLPAQNVIVPGGVGMAWGKGPLLALAFNEGNGTSAKDGVSGKTLAFQGAPQWDGQSVQLSGGAFVPVGSIDLANRSFTLATWLKIDQLDGGGQLGLFGGRAPMGAGQDDSGSVLHAGLKNGKLHFGFMGRDVAGQATVPTGQWVHVAYSYDVALNRGTLFINGVQDAQKAQKPYEGALETIGTTPMMKNGKFALRDVVVVEGALNASSVKLLSEKGLDALKAGQYQTEWRPLAGTPAAFQAWADVPEGSTVNATLEVGDAKGQVLDSKAVKLTAGQTSLPLAGLKPGAQVRVRSDWTATPKAAPRLNAFALTGNNLDVRWVTDKQWQKGSAQGGVEIDEPRS